MLTRKHIIEHKQPFADFTALFDVLDAEAASKLAMVAGDIAFILDDTGKIIDGSANPDRYPEFESWIGQDFASTLTVEGKPKAMEMLAAARKGLSQHWRQVNHAQTENSLTIQYVIIPLAEADRHIAIGRDMREAAQLQQKLLQAQQSLERDYMRLRQLETRYRVLFEQSSEAVLVVDADNHQVREANGAAYGVLDAKPGSLAGKRLLGLFQRSERESLIAFLGSALVSEKVSPISLATASGDREVSLTATGFRQRGQQFLLVRLFTGEAALSGETSTMLDIVESMPDAFAMTDTLGRICAANQSFIELVGAAGAEQVQGNMLSDWIGRPGIDLDLIDGQLAKQGVARNVNTVVGASESFEGEPVELSAVRVGTDERFTGYVIRPIARRLRDLPPTTQDLPRSVEQLTELVGRMSLKEIVRESTDLIERLCIEAALSYTSDNRASAAEILGLSRQSLYSKLHRYGLGNLSDDAG
ncbi:transcriptional regulator PpsR [Erythrobacter sp. HA6-11]